MASETPETVNQLGIEQAEAGNVAQAERHFRQATSAGLAGAAFNLGKLLTQEKRFDEAVAAYEDAVRLGDVDAHISLGNLLSDVLDNQDEARAHYRAAWEAGDPDGAINLGVQCEQLGETEQAEEWYRAAIAAGDAKAHWQLAELLEEKGDAESAEEHYRAAIAAGEERAYPDLAHLLAARGSLHEAENIYRRATERWDREYLLDYADMLAGQPERQSEAIAVYRQAIDAGVIQAHNDLGALLLDMGETGAGETELRRGVDLGDDLAARNLASLLDSLGRADEAEELRQRFDMER